MKIVKLLVVFIVIAALGIAGLFWFGLSRLDSMAKSLIEKGGTHVLAVDTTLRKADVQIAQQAFAMEGLKIANPPGYKTSHFLTLGSGSVSVDIAKLLETKVVEVPTLALTSIDVNLDKSGGKANYQQILENAKRFEDSGDAPPAGTTSENNYKFVIRRIEIRDINAHAQLLPIGGDATKVDINVPEVVLTDVGSAGEPLSTSELINLITKAVLSSIIEVGGNRLPVEMLGDLQGSLSSLSSLGGIGTQIFDKSGTVVGDLQGTIGGLKGAADDTIKGLKEGADKLKKDADKIGEGVKDLLGGGKDK